MDNHEAAAQDVEPEKNGQAADVVTIGDMTEGDLRRLIREEMSAQMKDVPSRADVDALIQREIKGVEERTRTIVTRGEERSDEKLRGAVRGLDDKIGGLHRRIDDIGANLLTLNKLVEEIGRNISNNHNSMDARLSKARADMGNLDTRLDALEPVLKVTTEAVFGNGDGVPGMRNQVNTMALGMGTMREGLADINRWMARYDAMAQQRQKQIERAFAFVNSWYVRMGVLVVVASLLEEPVGDVLKLLGGL